MVSVTTPNGFDLDDSGQRVVVRAEMPAEPLIVQWWRAALRLFQRRPSS